MSTETEYKANEQKCSICGIIQNLENFYHDRDRNGDQIRRKDCKDCFRDRRGGTLRGKHAFRKQTMEERLDSVSEKITDLSVAIQEMIKGYEDVLRTQDRIIQELIAAGIFKPTDQQREDLNQISNLTSGI